MGDFGVSGPIFKGGGRAFPAFLAIFFGLYGQVMDLRTYWGGVWKKILTGPTYPPTLLLPAICGLKIFSHLINGWTMNKQGRWWQTIIPQSDIPCRNNQELLWDINNKISFTNFHFWMYCFPWLSLTFVTHKTIVRMYAHHQHCCFSFRVACIPNELAWNPSGSNEHFSSLSPLSPSRTLSHPLLKKYFLPFPAMIFWAKT